MEPEPPVFTHASLFSGVFKQLNQGQMGYNSSCQVKRGTLDTISKLYQLLSFLLISMLHFFQIRVCAQYQVLCPLRRIDKHVKHWGVWQKIFFDCCQGQSFLCFFCSTHSFSPFCRLVFPKTWSENPWHSSKNTLLSNEDDRVFRVRNGFRIACNVCQLQLPAPFFSCIIFLRKFLSNTSAVRFSLHTGFHNGHNV